MLKARGEDLKSGEYQFTKNASLAEVVGTIIENKVVQHTLTIAEGLTSEQIIAKLLENDVLSGQIKEIPREGTLLPETYKFVRGMSRDQIIQRMQQAHKRVLAEVWERRMQDLPVRTPEQLVTLASIVEKETGKPDERTRVAAVFVNRLKNKMRLQVRSDHHLWPDRRQRLTRPSDHAERNRPADALQYLRHRRLAAGPDRQSGPGFARGCRQSGAHQGTVLRRRRYRRSCLLRKLCRAPEERRQAARDGAPAAEPRTVEADDQPVAATPPAAAAPAAAAPAKPASMPKAAPKGAAPRASAPASIIASEPPAVEPRATPENRPAARLRVAASISSQPGGNRMRKSKPLALTDFNSHSNA